MFTALDPFEGTWDDPMSINGYSYVHGNPVNFVDPSGECGQPTNWGDPFDANCYSSAEGLAQRLSGGDPTLYQIYFDVLIQQSWGDLKAVEAKLTGDDISGFFGYVGDRASIIPRLFAENPELAWQALQQYFNSCNGSSQVALGATAGAGVLGGQGTGAIGGTNTGTQSGGGSGSYGLITLLLLIAAGLTELARDYTRDRTRDDNDTKETFYRGGTYYDALRWQDPSQVDDAINALSNRQSGRDFDEGFYTSINRAVAQYFGNINVQFYGGGQGGGAMMIITLGHRDFERIRGTYGVVHNRPIVDSVPASIPQPHVETIFPYLSLPELFLVSQVEVEPY